MAGLTYQQIYSEVGNEFSGQDTARLKLWTNRAYHWFLNERTWSFLESISSVVTLNAGQQGYTLVGTSPVVTDFGGMIDVQMELSSGGARVQLFPWESQQDFHRITAHSRSNGVPTTYCLAGGSPASSSATVTSGGQQQILLHPIPLATATFGTGLIFSYKRSAESVEMTADSDVPIVPVRHQWMIAEKAKAIGYRQEGQPNQAQACEAAYQAGLQTAIQEDMLQRPPRESLSLQLAPAAAVSQRTAQAQSDPARRVYPVERG